MVTVKVSSGLHSFPSVKKRKGVRDSSGVANSDRSPLGTESKP
jgi:hypothetical protein